MGLPIGDIVLACNENRLVADYLQGAPWEPRASVHTLASAMDVGNPSNMERLTALHGDASVLAKELQVAVVSDAEIEEQIRVNYEQFGFATCPHTATATHAWRALPRAARDTQDWIIVATAHPAKFESIVEALTGARIALPPELEKILARPSRSIRIEATLDALKSAMADLRVDGTTTARDK
jgi:threonine synthase